MFHATSSHCREHLQEMKLSRARSTDKQNNGQNCVLVLVDQFGVDPGANQNPTSDKNNMTKPIWAYQQPVL